jgi:hypothetical protein
MIDKTLPILFIFDLDNTLIGNPVYILSYKYLLDFIKDGCKHNRLNGVECKIDYNVWNNKIIDEKFFRPKLKESLQEIKTIFPNAEFFIFSLGTKDYVTPIVQFLEKYTGISFTPTEKKNETKFYIKTYIFSFKYLFSFSNVSKRSSKSSKYSLFLLMKFIT